MHKLKIKDDVNLEELKKFDFEERNMGGPCYVKYFGNGLVVIHAEHKIGGRNIAGAREIKCVRLDSKLHDIEFGEFLFTIYDLMQAGFVEKAKWRRYEN